MVDGVCTRRRANGCARLIRAAVVRLEESGAANAIMRDEIRNGGGVDGEK